MKQRIKDDLAVIGLGSVAVAIVIGVLTIIKFIWEMLP